ncbi:MAG: T9SS type A sorting domain-containing protein [Bacteroidia bacterium]|nr:T9SS type A sorting domain-containing protein [Bacteroidia bacterium]
MQRAILFTILLVTALFAGAQTAHQYAYHDTVETARNKSVMVHVTKNDSFKAPKSAANYMATPVICDYPFFYGTFTSKEGGTWKIVNADSIEYSPKANFTGKDQIYYGICNSGSKYNWDTGIVYIDVVAMSSLEVIEDEPEFSIYPNPSREVITLKVSPEALSPELHISIIDVLGTTIKEIPIIKASTKLNIKELNIGIYFFQLQDESGIIATRKMIVK